VIRRSWTQGTRHVVPFALTMRFSASLSLAFGLFGAVSAQYFSAGWAPGQPVQQESATEWSPNQAVPRNAQSRQQTSFDWTKLLTDGPVGSLFEKAGINITKNIEDAALKEANRWDKRIPLITDDNYDNIIVNEALTEEEEQERIWFIVMSVSSPYLQLPKLT
jgi:hypothetical protein